MEIDQNDDKHKPLGLFGVLQLVLVIIGAWAVAGFLVYYIWQVVKVGWQLAERISGA